MAIFAFILGVLPLAIAHGAGAEMRRTLGTAVFAGMIGVTVFGIFLTPVFYYVIRGLLRAAVPAGAPAAAAATAARSRVHGVVTPFPLPRQMGSTALERAEGPTS